MIEIQFLEISFILISLCFYVLKKNETKDDKVCIDICWYSVAEPYLYDNGQSLAIVTIWSTQQALARSINAKAFRERSAAFGKEENRRWKWSSILYLRVLPKASFVG